MNRFKDGDIISFEEQGSKIKGKCDGRTGTFLCITIIQESNPNGNRFNKGSNVGFRTSLMSNIIKHDSAHLL